MYFSKKFTFIVFSIAQNMASVHGGEILQTLNQLKSNANNIPETFQIKKFQANLLMLAYIIAFMECKRTQPNDVITFIKNNIGLFSYLFTFEISHLSLLYLKFFFNF